MDDKGTNDFYELQLKLESCLSLLAKKHNELSKKLSGAANADKKGDKLKVIFISIYLYEMFDIKKMFCM